MRRISLFSLFKKTKIIILTFGLAACSVQAPVSTLITATNIPTHLAIPTITSTLVPSPTNTSLPTRTHTVTQAPPSPTLTPIPTHTETPTSTLSTSGDFLELEGYIELVFTGQLSLEDDDTNQPLSENIILHTEPSLQPFSCNGCYALIFDPDCEYNLPTENPGVDSFIFLQGTDFRYLVQGQSAGSLESDSIFVPSMPVIQVKYIELIQGNNEIYLQSQYHSPVIESVNLRYVTSSEGLVIYQDIYFRDQEGDANFIDYELVSTDPYTTVTVVDGSLDLPAQKQKTGALVTGKWTCGMDKNGKTYQYNVTLGVTILDKAGNRSNRVDYTMKCQ